jgi:heme-degrading monooxygenase HmoA
MTQFSKSVRIRKKGDYVTEINFLHMNPEQQSQVVEGVQQTARQLAQQPGLVSVSVLRSTDGTRVATYTQWQTADLLQKAHEHVPTALGQGYRSLIEPESGQPRLYDVVYADDRSAEGVTTISYQNMDTIFMNKITTQSATQMRLLELVIANNEEQSFRTPGYRSANFHKSHDGARAVNYSLWDSEQHLIEAITAMADEDVNLDETVEIATPDFRFYTLVYTAQA